MTVERVIAIVIALGTFLSLVFVPFGLRLLDAWIKRREATPTPPAPPTSDKFEAYLRSRIVELETEVSTERATKERYLAERNAAWDQLRGHDIEIIYVERRRPVPEVLPPHQD